MASRALIRGDIAKRKRAAVVGDSIAIVFMLALIALMLTMTGPGRWFWVVIAAVVIALTLKTFGSLPPPGPGRKAIIERSRARWRKPDAN